MYRSAALGDSSRFRGLRRTNIRTDLDGIADLLDLAFFEEKHLAPGSSSGRFASMKGYGPLIWLFSFLAPELANTFAGYVWVEEGEIVGNVNVSPLPDRGGLWLIGNVAVLPRFRRRGIARQLTQAAIDHARRRRARLVVLDVRADNSNAYTLYTGMGFQQAGGMTELRCSDIPLVASRPNAGLRRIDSREWQLVYQLALASSPPLAQQADPITPSHYRVGWLSRLGRWFTGPLLGQAEFQYGTFADGELVGWLGIDPASGRVANRLRILVRPDWRGEIEEQLIAWGLARLRQTSPLEVNAKIPVSHPEAVEVLKGFGFLEIETLHRLLLRLS